jgi:hypothetical protein
MMTLETFLSTVAALSGLLFVVASMLAIALSLTMTQITAASILSRIDHNEMRKHGK